MRQKLVKIHAVAATCALLMITVFFFSTLISELSGNQQYIVTAKSYIFYAIWLLIPTMAVAGITGNKLAPKANGAILGAKKKRMPFIALNGLVVLIPSAVYLKFLALNESFDTAFYIVQSIELIAGFTNITLMSLNLRDGLKIRNQKK
ncbi:hypothetical protein SG35_029975 [Thalassomonas actiniarum]|uniref:Uncharacterized protein n=2 Tax=Thalassomonas actiniarum TaxID=485447 RepID=A0AAE9YYJ5_9GAMM|nr:hypothetical protein SG35_029975 [Thalassomonas actiniarum]